MSRVVTIQYLREDTGHCVVTDSLAESKSFHYLTAKGRLEWLETLYHDLSEHQMLRVHHHVQMVDGEQQVTQLWVESPEASELRPYRVVALKDDLALTNAIRGVRAATPGPHGDYDLGAIRSFLRGEQPWMLTSRQVQELQKVGLSLVEITEDAP